MSEPLDREQLFRELSDIKASLKYGFEGVHARQDIANGRTTKLEGKVNLMWWLWSSLGALSLLLLNFFLGMFRGH